jgi:hypothetical protein
VKNHNTKSVKMKMNHIRVFPPSTFFPSGGVQKKKGRTTHTHTILSPHHTHRDDEDAVACCFLRGHRGTCDATLRVLHMMMLLPLKLDGMLSPQS